MGELVNLRSARKRKSRADEAAKAAANSLKYGASKSQRSLRSARQQLDDRTLDAARLPSRDDE